YPFTTLSPNLGVVYYGNESFVVADIPGLIKGAHLGAGLGDKFLRHIMRTIIIVLVLDCRQLIEDKKSLSETFKELRDELMQYNQSLYEKKYIIAINKIDLISDKKIISKAKKELLKLTDAEIIPVSAQTGENINDFIKILSGKVKFEKSIPAKEKELQEQSGNIRVYTLNEDTLKEENIKIITRGNEYFVENKYLERIVAMTDLENSEALDYLKNKLKKMGIGDKLKKMGIKEGSTVIIGKLVFELVG
ncbi:MAG: Obg family GTPase CgtA, partial [Candidatus Humimicrobiaceae bacterium]